MDAAHRTGALSQPRSGKSEVVWIMRDRECFERPADAARKQIQEKIQASGMRVNRKGGADSVQGAQPGGTSGLASRVAFRMKQVCSMC